MKYLITTILIAVSFSLFSQTYCSTEQFFYEGDKVTKESKKIKIAVADDYILISNPESEKSIVKKAIFEIKESKYSYLYEIDKNLKFSIRKHNGEITAVILIFKNGDVENYIRYDKKHD